MQAPGMEGREALVRGARAKEARVVEPPRGVGEGKVDGEGGRVEGRERGTTYYSGAKTEQQSSAGSGFL